MKKSTVLYTIITLAIGLVVSCDKFKFDVEEDLQGTWLCRPTALDNLKDAWMIMTDDTYELDLYPTGADDFPTNLLADSAQGALEADDGIYTTITYYRYDGALWQLIGPTTPETSFYVIAGNQVTITADWDGPGPGTVSPEVFIKQY